MSDEHNDPSHKTSGPGHEVDSPPTKELFNIVWGLGGLTLLSIATCAQLFYQQERDIQEERGKESSYQLVSYRKEMQERSAGNGSVEFKDSTGAIVRQKYRPLDAARAEVLSNPNALKASAAPAGWIHPDDIAAGGQGGTTPPGTPTGTAPGTGSTGADGQPPPAGTLPHPLGEPPQLPAGTGPVDPTSAEPIHPKPVEPPPPTPSIPPANPTPAPAPPVDNKPATPPATPPAAPAK